MLLAILFGSALGRVHFARATAQAAPIFSIVVLVMYLFMPGNRLDQPYDRVFWVVAVIVTTSMSLLARPEPPKRVKLALAGTLGIMLGVPGWLWSALFFLFAEAGPRGFRAMRPWDVFALVYSLFSFTVGVALLRLSTLKSTQTEAGL